jgi:hypothetical protein
MKFVSTTALAKRNNLEPIELFKLLTEKQWIYKKDGKWNLTKNGRIAGGDVKYNPKFGEYVVWPENLNFNKTVNSTKTVNATKIGEHFNISNRKVNLYLSELGWIEKGKGGWISTNSGVRNGAKQMEARNGKPYIIWDENVLTNKHLIREIKESQGDTAIQEEDHVQETLDDFRVKFPADLRTPDGHYVRSRAELLIDDFLYKNGIVHAYERKLNIDEDMYCDFYIPSEKLYIEYWGLEENEKYAQRKKVKQDIYKKYNINLIELNDDDITNLDERLAAKLRRFNIIVD